MYPANLQDVALKLSRRRQDTSKAEATLIIAAALLVPLVAFQAAGMAFALSALVLFSSPLASTARGDIF
jgi:hypothetical protein